MNVNQLLNEMAKMSNLDKDTILDMIYEEYFRVASDEQLLRDAKILEKYYDGELVEVEGDGY